MSFLTTVRDSIVRAVARAERAPLATQVAGEVYPKWNTGPRLGAKEMLTAYSQSPWLRAFVEKIAHDFATLTWQVYVATTPKGNAIHDIAIQRATTYQARTKLLAQRAAKGELREIPNHPLISLITSGNRWFSGLVTMELSQIHLDLVGEMAWLLELNRHGMPIEAVPFPPTWITKLPSQGGENRCYTISGPGGLYDVPMENVFFTYHPDPANPFRRGIGISQVLGDELETDEAAAKYTKDFFRNRAIPPVLITGLGVGLPELQRLEEKWLARHARKGAGWLPQFLGRDVKVHQLSQTFEQQQLGPLRQNERDTIRQVFGIPPEVVGIVEPGASRATIDTADFIYQARIQVPRAEFLRSAMQASLVPMFDERLILSYVSPVKEDRAFQLDVMKAMPEAWSLDEWRKHGDTDPMTDNRGTIHLVPIGKIPTRFTPDELDDLGRVGGSVPPEPPAGPSGVADLADAEVQADEDAADAMRASRVTRAIGPKDPNKIAKAADWRVLSKAGKPIVQAAIAHAGQEAINQVGVGIDFNLSNPRVEAHLREWALDRIANKVNETTRAAIRDSLADGVAAGETFEDLKHRIQDVFAEATDARAANIARTEITRSTGFASMEGLEQAGIEQKGWLSTNDTVVRDTHKELDGQVRPVSEPFEVPSTGATAMYPGEFGDPAEDCNCRCQVITADALRAMSSVQRATVWRARDVEREAYARRLRLSLRGAFRKQQAAVLAALAAAAGRSARGSTWRETA